MSCIWRFMYRDVLQPGDTFPMMMRKMVMALGLFIGTVAVYGLIQKFMSPQANTSTTYPCYISLVVTFFGSWIYVKCTHTAPTWLIALWTNSISVLALLQLLTNPNFPWEFTLIGIMICVLVCKASSSSSWPCTLCTSNPRSSRGQSSPLQPPLKCPSRFRRS